MNSVYRTKNKLALALLLSSTSLLSACQLFSEVQSVDENSEPEFNQQRKTLADLAQVELSTVDQEQSNISTVKKAALSAQARANKLADIYQTMLVVEPDENVRAQIKYRLVELDTENFQETGLVLADQKQSDQMLADLIESYQTLLSIYPDRQENEHIYYQLAKALDLQGELAQSLAINQRLLALYPETQYFAELAFRQAEIFYSQQQYDQALAAYQKVLMAANNDNYRLNSLYMSGWSLFKANRLAQADEKFIEVLSSLLEQQVEVGGEASPSFGQLTKSQQSLVKDAQRILTISLSQQAQSNSLVKLLDHYKSSKHGQKLAAIEHVFFQHLAEFLQEKQLEHDATLTYQAYITRKPNSIWSARFSLALINIAKKDQNFPEVRTLQQRYIEQYGLASAFWLQANAEQQAEVLPQLLSYSEQTSRRLYAQAQELTVAGKRKAAFTQAAKSLSTYLALAKLADSQYPKLAKAAHIDLIADEYLLADAYFEAEAYQAALTSYQYLAYQVQPLEKSTKRAKIEQLKLSSAYATTVTIRKLLKQAQKEQLKAEDIQLLVRQRDQLDQSFVKYYPQDPRAKVIASQAAQAAFAQANYQQVYFYSDYILSAYQIDQTTEHKHKRVGLTKSALKQVKIASELKANSQYQQQNYQAAEQSYLLALNYVDSEREQKKFNQLNELIASSIFQQGLALKTKQPLQAVEHWLRLAKVVPKSPYRVNAEFDAANLLLEQKQWQRANRVLLAFQQHFPKHKYTASIPAKLANSYQQLGEFSLAAAQLVVMQKSADSKELKRELQYSIAENYLKANDLAKAIVYFRQYAHTYPEPFGIAQEVRFKMSEFYRQTQEPNKRYFWYRKLLSFHKKDANKAQAAIQQRSTYLASVAAYELGQAHQQSFTRVKLKLPLNKSLKRKQKSLKQAVSYYQQVFDFALADFVPKANYQLASMYRQLAVDVLASQLPNKLDELALEEYKLLLEELAYPFEEKAIELYSTNAERAWQGLYDDWVIKSFQALAQLEPAKYNKTEQQPEAVYALF